MKHILILAIILLVSCTDGNKFNEKEMLEFKLENGIAYKINSGELHLEGSIIFEDEKVPLDRAKNYLYDFFWIVNNDTIKKIAEPKNIKINYGEHFIKLVLMDFCGDIASDSLAIRYDEPLRVDLLSPINGFSNFTDVDSLEFRFRIRGVDSWEQADSLVSVWPAESFPDTYYWRVEAWTERDAAVSEVRCLGKHC